MPFATSHLSRKIMASSRLVGMSCIAENVSYDLSSQPLQLRLTPNALLDWIRWQKSDSVPIDCPELERNMASMCRSFRDECIGR